MVLCHGKSGLLLSVEVQEHVLRNFPPKIAAGVIEFCTTVPAFWKVTGAAFRESHPRTTEGSGSRMKEALLKKPSARVVWLCALFLLGYVGVEVAVGGWIVVFMLRVRHGSAFSSGMIETGFWLGITVGRLVLGFVTPRIGEKLSIGVSFFTLQFFNAHTVLMMLPDLPTDRNGPAAHLLACPTILCLGSSSQSTGILLGTHVPCSSRCLHKAAAPSLAR